ncbi:helix-turn-helix domain-containing protein [Modicisalibacter sp. MOD 31.J]|uniref:helix-turn-helix domain-containing protein n=1 Tax=Modicisalibacter sp. MOD 31.J TaxID=2831897 RepID=UPI001CCD0345|nr:helix-turn-helix domain-containing protein [Modicisalibacter sp. MOD 31.J]MBZ9574381.1 helix-turn-helix domain-containing protein [Modicisalibacter sp. MOD 31.J]
MNQEIPINPTQRWEWLKYQLRSRGSSFRKLSDELGVSSNAVLMAKYGPYPRMERAIARKLDLSPSTIWPERWNADGTPSRQRPNRAERQAISYRNSNFDHKDDSGSNAIAHRQAAGGA